MSDLRTPCKTCGKPTLVAILESRGGKCIACSRREQESSLRESVSGLGQSLYPTAALLLANKSHEYQARVVSCAQGIAEFYTETGLANTDLSARFSSSPQTFSFSLADLSDSGKAFTTSAFNRWLANIDRWAPDADRSAIAYKANLAKAYQRFAAASG